MTDFVGHCFLLNKNNLRKTSLSECVTPEIDLLNLKLRIGIKFYIMTLAHNSEFIVANCESYLWKLIVGNFNDIWLPVCCCLWLAQSEFDSGHMIFMSWLAEFPFAAECVCLDLGYWNGRGLCGLSCGAGLVGSGGIRLDRRSWGEPHPPSVGWRRPRVYGSGVRGRSRNFKSCLVWEWGRRSGALRWDRRSINLLLWLGGRPSSPAAAPAECDGWWR